MAVELYTWADVAGINAALSGDYIQMNPLNKDSTGYSAYASATADSGKGWLAIGNSSTRFKGTYDGQGHTIADLAINRGALNSYQGVFGYLDTDSIIVNLTVTNANIISDTNVGCVAAYVRGQLINCHAKDSSVEVVLKWSNASYAGGVAGCFYLAKETINCSATNVTVKGASQIVGGFAGEMPTSATNCVVRGGSVSGTYQIGGFCGYGNLSSPKTMKNCSSTCSVTGNYASSEVGGFGGKMYLATASTLQNCYSAGSVTNLNGSGSFGGFCGFITKLSYQAKNCFWDTETSGTSTSATGTGKTTAEMKNILTFSGAGWDIATIGEHDSEIWKIDDGKTYPMLYWETYELPKYEVTFTEQNGLDGISINIYLDEEKTVLIDTLTTTSGIATIELEDGTYYYNAEKEGYYTTDGTLTIDGADEDVFFTLVLIPAPEPEPEWKPITSRTFVTVVKLEMDYCQNVFSQSPCEATGKHCYNTFPTCKDKLNFNRETKTYTFSSADTPIPFPGENIRPYILDINYLPTEIKDNFTISGRVNITLADEPDTDINIDPYITTRQAPYFETSFWKKFIERNKNYKGRAVTVYEGFLGEEWDNYAKKFVGRIENISINGAEIRLEVVDLFRSLAEVEIPKQIDCKLVTDITVDTADITLTSVEDIIDPTGYILIDEEIIEYTSKDTVTNQLIGCIRGAFNTIPAEHRAQDKVGLVRYYNNNPFDILTEMLIVDANLPPEYLGINSTFEFWRNYPVQDITFSGIITKPTKLSDLYFEIVDLLDAKSWISEDWIIEIRKNLPNQPGRAYHIIRDDTHILENSASVDTNEKSRYTRVLLYWDKKPLGDIDDTKQYARLDISVDADAESPNGYGDTIEKKFFCRWFRPGLAQEEVLAQYIRNFLARRLFRVRDAAPIIHCAVELKDTSMHTGDWVLVSTDELLESNGQPYKNVVFQIIKRERLGDKIELSLLKLNTNRICFITPNDFPEYAGASFAQREYGFISRADGMINDETEGYYIY